MTAKQKLSKEHRDTRNRIEKILLSKFIKDGRQSLKKYEQPTKTVYFNREKTISAKVDGHFEDKHGKVFVEIYTSIGNLVSGQRSKVAKDLLKLVVLKKIHSKRGKKARCYFIMPKIPKWFEDENCGANLFTDKKCWINPSHKQFYNVEFLTYPLSKRDMLSLQKTYQ